MTQEQPTTAQKLETIMDLTGTTQKEIADILGISQSYMSALLNDKRQAGRKLEKAFLEKHGIMKEWWISGETPVFREDSSLSQLAKKLIEPDLHQEYTPEVAAIIIVLDKMGRSLSPSARTYFFKKVSDYVNSDKLLEGISSIRFRLVNSADQEYLFACCNCKTKFSITGWTPSATRMWCPRCGIAGSPEDISHLKEIT